MEKPDGNCRERIERVERDVLSSRAQLASASKGRDVPENEDAMRTCFQRDRDRIVHSKAFRRLAHKTQVFLAPEGDHYRVRLTHTLEVTQVARTIARALRLNEDLVEAVCLGHDLGHTPFGHLGEEVVASWAPGFRHNLQSVRIVEVLEDLNLTWEVRDGIANHTWSMPMPATLEAQIARFADRIAYLNHDIDDAIRAGILSEGDLPAATRADLGSGHSERIQRMVGDLVANSEAGDIAMSTDIAEAMTVTRDFLFERVYLGRISPATKEAVYDIVRALLDHYVSNPIPQDEGWWAEDPRQAAVDYVAGMTDRFAIRAFKGLNGGRVPDLGALG
ncbi:MAG: deoxyguanosinetriphosphate triphosphohydrolase [Actinomycetota bacterium]|nr:deoxyguanosinetriphosphate triphosphohydrolase [Actinomycetota bacterium]